MSNIEVRHISYRRSAIYRTIDRTPRKRNICGRTICRALVRTTVLPSPPTDIQNCFQQQTHRIAYVARVSDKTHVHNIVRHRFHPSRAYRNIRIFRHPFELNPHLCAVHHISAMNNREKLSRRSRYNKIDIVRQRVAINERDTAIFVFSTTLSICSTPPIFTTSSSQSQ